MSEQVANNREAQVRLELSEGDDGEFRLIHTFVGQPSLIMHAYYPKGPVLQFPKKWGRKRGAEHMLAFFITDLETEIRQATARLEKLKRLSDKVSEWPDDLGWNEPSRM